MTYTVSNGTLNSTIPYHTYPRMFVCFHALVTPTTRLRFDGRSTAYQRSLRSVT